MPDCQPEGPASPEQLMRESRTHLETAIAFADQRMPRPSLSYASRSARLFLEAYYAKGQRSLPARSPAYDYHLLRYAADQGALALADELLLRSLWYVSEQYDYILAGSGAGIPIRRLLTKLLTLLEQMEAAVLSPAYLRRRPSS
ncbi:hypothetical protein [Gorillibacterium sp. sgz500922]|uniref:hypothetical protein n=1 Tax=Gorillibacterium sp. sgz500922 TaxID=3446694 RepID=UPI003F67B5AE